MAAPRPPSLDEIEEDLRTAPHTDVVFSRQAELKAGREGIGYVTYCDVEPPILYFVSQGGRAGGARRWRE